MPIKYIVPAVAVIIYLALVASVWGPNYEIVQRWRIAVEAPDGSTVYGDSNLKLVAVNYKGLLSQKITGGTTGLYGEAPFVKLGGKYLFALALYEPHKPIIVYKNYFSEDNVDRLETLERMSNYFGEVRIKADQLPVFFAFSDPKDSTTLREVDVRNLQSYFGEGYKFKYVSLRTTSENMTKGKVVKDFTWLKGDPKYFSYYYSLKTKNSDLMKRMKNSDLVRHWECIIDHYYVRNLTFGMFENGLDCGLRREHG